MPDHTIQYKPEFLNLHKVPQSEGDTITFTHGLVDAHGHGRDNNDALGDAMTDVLSHSVSQFALIVLQPNLFGSDALTTYKKSAAYHNRASGASANRVKILTTVYLTADLTEDDIKQIAEDENIAGVKHYPGHGTTNSEQGLRTPLEAQKQLEWMQKHRVTLLAHGQVRTKPDGTVIDEWDREPYFYEVTAQELNRRYPELPISYEHLSTGVGAQAVLDRKGPTQGTLTYLHLHHTRTDVMDKGVDTRMVMKPMVQHEEERPKLWKALRANPDRFALGSDDAWHPTTSKHATVCTCGGCYGPYRVGFYLDAFEKENALDLFGRFACVNAARFYGVTIPPKTITLRRGTYKIPRMLPFGKHLAEPLYSGEERFGWYQMEV